MDSIKELSVEGEVEPIVFDRDLESEHAKKIIQPESKFLALLFRTVYSKKLPLEKEIFRINWRMGKLTSRF